MMQTNIQTKNPENLSLNKGYKGDIDIIKTKFCVKEEDKPPKVTLKKPLEKFGEIPKAI